jgi:magnesium transporter
VLLCRIVESHADSSRRTEVLAETLEKFLERGARANISKLLGRVRPEDVADLLATLEVDRQLEVFAILSADYPDAAGEVLTALEPAPRLALLERLTPEQIAFILERVPVDDAVFVVESLPPALQERVLALVDLKDLTDVQTQLAYPESSAGRLMDTEFFALPEGETVRAAIAAIQEQRDVEMIFYLYVVDRDSHLVGVTSLRQLLLSKPDQTLADIMQRSVIKARVDTDQEEVAELAARYDLLAIPVVDDQNRMAGIVTVDDIIDVVKEEATDDLFKVAGTSEDELIYEERTLKVAGLRLKSLLVSLAGLLVTGLLLEFFQVRFVEAMFLLAFVPVIMGLGGSIGGQASAVTLRGLATGRFGGEEGGFLDVLFRQIKVGAVLGLSCGVLAGVAAVLLKQNLWYGLVVAVALFCAVVLASLIGACGPFIFDRLGFDPALAAGPAVATLNDITGILIYFGLAQLFLGHLLR